MNEASDWEIRSERGGDEAGIHAVHDAAFGHPGEGNLVDLLRVHEHLLVSLCAEIKAKIVGHVAFSPVSIVHPKTGRAQSTATIGMGLAPVGVLPNLQRRGIGRGLIEAGLQACRELKIRGRGEVGFVVVLGDPAYYGRFGFVRADKTFGLGNEYGCDAEFQAFALHSKTLDKLGGGLIKYSAEFGELAV